MYFLHQGSIWVGLGMAAWILLGVAPAPAVAPILEQTVPPSETFSQKSATRNCVVQRIDGQLVRCDVLTGTGAPAPLWVPESAADRKLKAVFPQCPLERIGRQLVRCDSLAGAGVPAPLWVPER